MEVELAKYYPKGPRFNEALYELTTSENPQEELERLGKLPVREFILGLKKLEPFRERVLEIYDLNVRSNTMMEGTVKCKYCSSTDTIFTLRQTRSSDEAPTLILFCNSCGRRSISEE